MEMQTQDMLKYFLEILQKRDYSVAELIEKAVKRKFDSTVIKSALVILKNKKMIDDKRLAENIVYYYSGKKGEMWIKEKLKTRQIPEIYWPEFKNTEQDLVLLKNKVQKKYNITDFQNIDFKLRNKIISYLYRQGFANSFEILKDWQNESQ